MRIHKISVLLLAPLLLTLPACDKVKSLFAAKPQISYAAAGEAYAEKPDLAQVEYQYPIALTELTKVTPAYLASLNQEQLDQLYARLSAGPIPNGPFEGAVVFYKGSSGRLRVAEIVGGLKGLALEFKAKKAEIIAETLWKGKVFYRDQRVLRNRIEDLAVLRPIIGTGAIAKIDVDGKDAWLLFPAKLYCGQSLLDSRRESVIIDYAYSDELPGYREVPDFLAGRNGLKVRDEIRMVRPGLYLGRAYMDRVFLLNFILYNKSLAELGEADFLAGKVKEDCWPGTQPRITTAAK
ncbi:MAG: hypothetical protein AABY73_04280 [Pseudomonadota bacterium]|mgnify:CR=1 FL=1